MIPWACTETYRESPKTYLLFTKKNLLFFLIPFELDFIFENLRGNKEILIFSIKFDRTVNHLAT